jgi:hypothetical protein
MTKTIINVFTFGLLVAIAMAAPIAVTIILIKLATAIPGLQLILAIILTAPTVVASLLSGVCVGEKLKELL